MNITINTISIYDYALALTARAGKTSESYEDVALTEDNYPMLDVYLSSGVSHAEGELRRKLADSNSFDLKVTEENVDIVLDDAVRRDLAVLSLTETSIRLFLGYYIAAEWLRPTPAGALSEVYATTAATHLQTAVNALNQREETRVSDSDYSNRQDEGNVRMDAKSGSDAVYSERNTESDKDLLSKSGSDAVYSERNTESDKDLLSKSGSDAVYSERNTESDMKLNGTNSGASKFQRRNNDTVMARRGTRIVCAKILTVRDEDCPCKENPTITAISEILISNS